MIGKVSITTTVIGAALAFAAPANSSPGCPTQRGACHPAGVRPIDQRPRSESLRPAVPSCTQISGDRPRGESVITLWSNDPPSSTQGGERGYQPLSPDGRTRIPCLRSPGDASSSRSSIRR